MPSSEPSSQTARVVAVANQKGGVAKTTTVASLGAAFAELGKRVLLVDLDPQACLTFSLGVDPDTVDASVHEVLVGRAELADVIIECADGVDLVPSTIDLAGAEAMLLPRGKTLTVTLSNHDATFGGTTTGKIAIHSVTLRLSVLQRAVSH